MEIKNLFSSNQNFRFVKAFIILLVLLVPLLVVSELMNQRILFRQKAVGGGPSFSLNPATLTVNPSQEFAVEIKINTAGQLSSGASVQITFDKNIFEALEITPGKDVTQIPPMFPTVLKKTMDNQAGKIYLDAGVDVASPLYYVGEGVFGKIKFKVKDQALAGTNAISFFLTDTNNPKVLGDCDIIGTQDKIGQDLLAEINNSTVVISTSPITTGTPMPSPTDTPGEKSFFFKAGFRGYSSTNQPQMLVTLKANGTTFSKKVTLSETGESPETSLSGLTVGQTYELVLSIEGYLTAKKSLTVAAGRNPASDFFDFGSLRSGDLNGDNQINGLDWSLMKMNFGESGEE